VGRRIQLDFENDTLTRCEIYWVRDHGLVNRYIRRSIVGSDRTGASLSSPPLRQLFNQIAGRFQNCVQFVSARTGTKLTQHSKITVQTHSPHCAREHSHCTNANDPCPSHRGFCRAAALGRIAPSAGTPLDSPYCLPPSRSPAPGAIRRACGRRRFRSGTLERWRFTPGSTRANSGLMSSVPGRVKFPPAMAGCK
jgi:hypothetical protein